MAKPNPYQQGLDKNSANFVALSPLSYLERTARVFPRQVALVHGDLRQTWGETYTRCRRLASALQARGVGVGDTVGLAREAALKLEESAGVSTAK